MRIETDLDGAVVAAIERHYNHAKEKHPYFCDLMCHDKTRFDSAGFMLGDCRSRIESATSVGGGVRCERCGERFCATEIGEEGICPDCAKARREEAEAEDAEEELGDLCHED